ncbi:MAG: UbiD family decarboxylase [Alphaproteobacteria bacterium]|nr:UbiD family decarboxylase [Alphaproteobacteria bacterium]
MIANMSKQDLRFWLAQVEESRDVTHIRGADRDEEIGGVLDLSMRKMGNPALMFDEVPGFAKGQRVLANILTSTQRINQALGIKATGSEMELIQWWRSYMRNAPTHKPRTVNGGPVLENVEEGAKVDILKFPTPKWHEHDGGYFIGTACLVIMKDPDTGWVNYGAYRVQVHEPRVATVMMSPGKHGRLIMRKFHERGEPCPVAVVAGVHPAIFMLAGLEVAYGKSEYDAAGGIFGEPVEVIAMPKTGLPVPSYSEIAFEGYIHPNDEVLEGPLGEWTGYYAGGQRPEPAIRIETLMYRNDPIIVGAIPAVPPNDNTFYLGTYRCGAIWNQLEAAGVPEIKGVWTHEAGGSRMWTTVAIKQLYGGHSKQAGLIASQCHAGAYANRWTVVVDDDIDPTSINDVIWAMCTRFDPREGMEIIRGCWSTHLDPMCYDGDTDRRNARVVIDACRPFNRRDTFPIVARSSKALDDRIKAKWSHVLPKS